MTESDYFNAWVFYLGGAGLLALVWWRISRGWYSWIRYPSLLVVMAALVVPFNVESGSLLMAPAWLIAFFEGVFLPDIGFLRAGPTFIAVLFLALLIYPVLRLLMWLVGRLRGSKEDKPAESSVG